jgi:hypothetical protein
MGKKLSIDSINVFLASSREKGAIYQSCALYVTTATKLEVHQSQLSPIFIELSRNSAHPSNYNPVLPDAVFTNYWSKDNGLDLLVKRYVKVRDLEDPEEQFIGMFRILEKCTARSKFYFEREKLELFLNRINKNVKFLGEKRQTVCDFSKRIIKLNEQKADAKSNILAFIKSIPKEVIAYVGIDIEIAKELADLRNNITHANPYKLSEEDFYLRHLQCQLLATSALLVKLEIPWKTIGMSVATINPYFGRRHGMLLGTYLTYFDDSGVYVGNKPATEA